MYNLLYSLFYFIFFYGAAAFPARRRVETEIRRMSRLIQDDAMQLHARRTVLFEIQRRHAVQLSLSLSREGKYSNETRERDARDRTFS